MNGNDTHRGPLRHRLGAYVFLAILTLVGPLRAAEQAVSGKKLLLKDTGKLVLVSRDPSVSIAGSDPATGAESFIRFSLDGGPPVTFDLPGSLWKTNRSGTVLKYKNRSAPAGPSPVKVARVKRGLIRVVAKGVPFAVPSGAATVDAVLSLDSGTTVHCMTFSGTGDGTTFRVRNATAGSCPPAAPASTPTIPPTDTPTSTPTHTVATATPSATPTASEPPPACTLGFQISPVALTIDPSPVQITAILTYSDCDPALIYTVQWSCGSGSDPDNCAAFLAQDPVREESPGEISESRLLNTIALATYSITATPQGALPDNTVVVTATTLTSTIDVTEEP